MANDGDVSNVLADPAMVARINLLVLYEIFFIREKNEVKVVTLAAAFGGLQLV